MTAIEWTDATWNPIVGCSVVSPGCTNCYAMKMAARIEAYGNAPHYAGATKKTKAGPVWTGKVALAPENILTQPLRWRKGRKIFVNSMGDLFHESVPDAWIDRVFAVMALCPRHTFQVLTKRAKRMREWFERERVRAAPVECISELYVEYPNVAEKWPFDKDRALGVGVRGWPLPNVWLGVSVEDQERADGRIPDLLATPAAGRFVSVEPLLGPVRLDRLEIARGEVVDQAFGPGIDKVVLTLNTLSGAQKSGIPALNWVIVGGESGRGARPFDLVWARNIIAQCKSAGVACFVKQIGARPNDSEKYFPFATVRDRKGGDPNEWPEDLRVREFPEVNHERINQSGSRESGQ